MKKSLLLLLTTTLLVVISVIIGMRMDTTPAYALCATPAEEGQWTNYDPNTRSITRIDVRFQCQDQVLNGEPYPPGWPYYLHLYGSCHPTDCDWGEMGAKRYSNDWIRTTIDQGFATRYVWVKAYPSDSQEWLRVWIWTDFQDPNRADYASNDWFTRS